MTAMFVVIFVEQWLKDSSHVSAILGIVLSVISLLLFGPDHFVIALSPPRATPQVGEGGRQGI